MASPANPRLQPQNLTLLACHSDPCEDIYSWLIQQNPVKTRDPVLNADDSDLCQPLYNICCNNLFD